MAYVHFEDMSEVIVSTELALRPEQLVSFLVSATLQQQTIQHHQQAQRARSHSADAVYSAMSSPLKGYDSIGTPHGDRGAVSAGTVGGSSVEDGVPLLPDSPVHVTPTKLTASKEALVVARQAVCLLEEQVNALMLEDEGGSSVAPSSNSSSRAGDCGNECVRGLELRPIIAQR
jgi:hypothetical protein